MQVDLSEYNLLNKRLTGQNLKIFFGKIDDSKPSMVLKLTNIVAFISSDNNQKNKTVVLRIDKTGSYSLDISMQLKRPEIKHFQEVFLFTDLSCINFSFRALAEQVDWEPFDNSAPVHINY